MESKIELNPRIEELIKDVIRDTTLSKQDIINLFLNEGYDNYFFTSSYEDLIDDTLEEFKKPREYIKEAQYVQYVDGNAQSLQRVFSSFPKWLDNALHRGKVDRYYNYKTKTNDVLVGNKSLELGDWICLQPNGQITFLKLEEFSRRDVICAINKNG